MFTLSSDRLGGYCRCYWLRQFESFLCCEVHVVDLLSMQLCMLDKLIVCLGLYHKAAVAIDLFSHDGLAPPLTLVPNKMA